MSVFKFKQFSVDQTGCAMKINTDGVLLGAMAEATLPEQMLDIGTGTGVIALMLAQRFPNAKVDAVEIDEIAARTARLNFESSPFSDRMTAFPLDFETFFNEHADRKYDLIVSNPPFFLNSLVSPGIKKNLAKHTDDEFYNRLIYCTSQHLSELGTLQLVLPVPTSKLVKKLLPAAGLYLLKQFNIRSFMEDEVHRELLVIGTQKADFIQEHLIIYEKQKLYSFYYQSLLKDFLTIF